MSKDLIFAMGPPGSRWSGILRCIQMYSKNINTSDDNENRVWDRIVLNEGKHSYVGWHRGSYFGPGHEFGKGFDDIKSNYTRESFLAEIKRPFETWEGTKIIKSHWFAYNIETLKEWFPDSKLIAVKYGDEYDMFAWWHYVGGWDIKYPHYSWYKNNQLMFSKIQEESLAIDKHFDCRMNRSIQEIGDLLGLGNDIRSAEEMLHLDDKFTTNQSHDLSQSQHLKSFSTAAARLHIGVI